MPADSIDGVVPVVGPTRAPDRRVLVLGGIHVLGEESQQSRAEFLGGW